MFRVYAVPFHHGLKAVVFDPHFILLMIPPRPFSWLVSTFFSVSIGDVQGSSHLFFLPAWFFPCITPDSGFVFLLAASFPEFAFCVSRLVVKGLPPKSSLRLFSSVSNFFLWTALFVLFNAWCWDFPPFLFRVIECSSGIATSISFCFSPG